MNRDQIIQMARENGIAAGFNVNNEDMVACFSFTLLESFAAAIRAATKEEDAKICEQTYVYDEYDPAESLASAIRESK